MTSTRRKAAKLPAVQSKDAAIATLAEYGTLDAAIERLRLEAEAKIAAIRAETDTATEPLEAELKARFNALKPWWAVAGAELTEGKRKSIELGGCVIGHRMTTPKLDLGGLGEDAAIAAIALAFADDEGVRRDAIRVKAELNKPTLLGWLGDPDSLVGKGLRALGITPKQTEQFFIDRIPPKTPAVEIVVNPAEQEAA